MFGQREAGIAIAGMMLAAVSVSAQESDYEWRYGHQMGARAPAQPHANAVSATAADGAVYANRNYSEFAVSVWNFEPAAEPVPFEEAQKPLEGADLAHLRATHTDAFIAVKNGVIHYEYYAKGMYPTTKHTTYSAGKSWTSAIWSDPVLAVLDRQVGEILTELEGTAYGMQRMRDIVDMRAPLDWWEDYADPESPVVAYGLAGGYEFERVDYDLIEFMASMLLDPALSVGEWHYVSPNAAVIALAGSRLANEHPYDRLNAFGNALGLEYISGTVANLSGQYVADGGQYFALRDFVKLPHMMARGGMVGDRRVVSESYIDDIFTADDAKAAAWKAGQLAEVLSEVTHYSNQWYVVDNDIALAIGSYGQFMAFNRATGAALAKFSTYETAGDGEMIARDAAWLIEMIRRAE